MRVRVTYAEVNIYESTIEVDEQDVRNYLATVCTTGMCEPPFTSIDVLEYLQHADRTDWFDGGDANFIRVEQRDVELVDLVTEEVPV